MNGADIQVVLGPDIARRLRNALEYVERMQRGSVGQNGGRQGASIPIPKIGKAHDNIAPRTFGGVDIWTGKPGSEVASTFITSPVLHFNLLDRTITAGKFVWMFGQYIFGAVFPALIVKGTVGAGVTFGGSATVTVGSYYGGDNPGATITGYPDETYTGTTIASGKQVRCEWDDKLQKYWIVGAQC